MKEIELFYLTRCPYCKNAEKAIDALLLENPAYAEIKICRIEESEHPEIANERDYYSVPTVFYRGEKLYEAKPFDSYDVIKDSLRAAFDRVLSD